MNSKQYKQAKAVIRKGCHIEGRYIDSRGKACAIGCLALAAGMSKKCIRTNGFEVKKVVANHFGLFEEDQHRVIRANDSDYTNRLERVAAVLDELHNIYVQSNPRKDQCRKLCEQAAAAGGGA